MGKDLVAVSSSARAIFEQADRVLGFSLSGLCFEGPEEELRKTMNTQPALYTASAAVLAMLRERGVEGAPGWVAGHSLGEYSALYAAGVFDFETGLRLVRARGEAMASAGSERPGAMAAVIGLDGPKVAELCSQTAAALSGGGCACCSCAPGAGIVQPANFNAPDQTVISGDKAAVEAACEAIKKAGAKRVLPLPVSGAFHTPLVLPAAEVMRQKLSEAALSVPGAGFINNADAQFLSDPEAIRDSLVRQVVSPVRWVESIQALWDAGCRRFVEVGSGKVLAGLVKRIARDAEVFTTESAQAVEATATALR